MMRATHHMLAGTNARKIPAAALDRHSVIGYVKFIRMNTAACSFRMVGTQSACAVRNREVPEVSRQKNWEDVRDWLVKQIESGEMMVGSPLPIESELQKITGAGRHSLRRAIASLAEEGRLSVEQGRGTFVAAPPQIVYRIGRRTRFRETLLAQGIEPLREVISTEILPAPAHVAKMLGLAGGALVTRCVSRSYGNGVPVGIGIIWNCALRFPDMAERRRRGESVTDVYRSHGVADYQRRETMLSARKPEKWEARTLLQPTDSPVVEQEKIDVAPDGVPIGFSESIWAAGRVRFLIDTQENG
ncbi:phosphonate metabolism transcriptional regulator PhnF [Mesorhizobium retamae]|uniref:Phosphonate metabolism transcriptional regulator PhnF n=1 Tax=Mesorhizobium retamae TaxID=2912854 RepID=A0ABS9QDC3_9HYPH|nr:phosphonate metabolism transcriptional regulator PhnF [Mesorhizobium sp. IRAMC:0171]MCG7505418.1 phosphonate metabolism transcriptional regulator PhnF [Mesorhizobium sp. IRAMC:0171]